MCLTISLVDDFAAPTVCVAIYAIVGIYVFLPAFSLRVNDANPASKNHWRVFAFQKSKDAFFIYILSVLVYNTST